MQGLKLFSDNKEEVIMIYGNSESQTVEDLLKKAHNTPKKNFRVIVVDSAPDYFGRSCVKRLANHGIKC
jgi:translation initiation factor 2B subunit (eIF-2B alpha/beta/delta family)